MQQENDNEFSTIDKVDSDEQKLCEVAKHPFGIVILYIQAGIGFLAALFIVFILLPDFIGRSETAFMVASILSLGMLLLAVIILIIATFIYRQNRLIVTNRNITQILQYGLFNRKVSQLNLVNVEDVTSIQNGILATLFGFGELKIETAGEQANFHFTYCPRPGYHAKVILEARERILGQHDGNDIMDGPANKTSLRM